MRDCTTFKPTASDGLGQAVYRDMLKRPNKNREAFKRKPYDTSVTIKKKVRINKEVKNI